MFLQEMSQEACVSFTGNTYSVPITALKFFNNILLAGMCITFKYHWIIATIDK